MEMPKINDKHISSIWNRIDEVVMMILENDRWFHAKHAPELARVVMKKFNVSKRTAHRYVEEARKEIRELSKPKKKKAFEKAMRDRALLFNKAITEGDYKLALSVAMDRDEILGLYSNENDKDKDKEMTIKNIDMSQFTEYGLERIKRGDKLEDVLMDPKAIKK